MEALLDESKPNRPVLEQDSYPAYIALARALRHEEVWRARGNCAGRGAEELWAWTLNKSEEGWDPVREKMALLSCAMCPVKYDCLEWALREQQIGCIWALKWTHRKQLLKQPDWREIIEQARTENWSLDNVLDLIRRRHAGDL